MKFTATYPLGIRGAGTEFLEPSALVEFARAAESHGYQAVALTEHPMPPKAWLDAGGHHAFDPMTALGFCAAHTRDLTLMSYLSVLPYRNPFLLAKAAATLDTLSGGRLILAAGSGYLVKEFRALGVPFEERNRLVDEAVEAMKLAWTGEPVTYRGADFVAEEHVALPRPVQQPQAMFWFGGNSQAARERVARHGSGWTPLMTDPALAGHIRTAAISGAAELAERIEDLRTRTAAVGRDPWVIEVQVQLSGQILDVDRFDADEHLEWNEKMAAIGVTRVVVQTDPRSPAASLESLERYSEEVISRT